MANPEEVARMRVREFYLEQARRFQKLADEYSPESHRENPLPIHGYGCVVRLHGNDLAELSRYAKYASDDLSIEYYGREEPRAKSESFSGTHSITFERVYPEQTQQSYESNLLLWHEERKRKRKREAGAEK